MALSKGGFFTVRVDSMTARTGDQASMNVRDSLDGVAEELSDGLLMLHPFLGLDSRPTNPEYRRSPVPANKDFSPGKG